MTVQRSFPRRSFLAAAAAVPFLAACGGDDDPPAPVSVLDTAKGDARFSTLVAAIEAAGLPVQVVNKVKDGRPHIADLVKAGKVQLVYTTVEETRTAIADSRYIRTAALANRVTYYTTMAGCEAATEALKYGASIDVASLQELHARLN